VGLLAAVALASTAVAWSLARQGGGAGSAEGRHRAIPHYEAGALRLEELKQARLAGDGAGAERALAAATAALDRALAADPAFELAYVGRARCHQHDGDVAAALADYDRALGLNPQLADALYERARLRFHRHLGRQVGLGVQDAVEMANIRGDLTRLAQLGTRGEREHAVAAMLHLLAGELESAIQETGRAVERNEYFADAWVLRAAARTARGYLLRGTRQPEAGAAALEAALEDVAQAERRGATPTDVLLGRAQALAGLFRLPEARADAERLLALAPRDSAARLLRARLAMMAGDRAEALADLAAVVAQDGTTADVRLARATVLLVPAMAFVTGMAGAGLDGSRLDPADLRQARADLDWIVSGAPTHAIARFYRALASAVGGDLPGAARDLHLFLRLSSEQSAFADAARLWLGTLGPLAPPAPVEPAALFAALEAVQDAEGRLAARRDAAAVERVHGALDDLSGLAAGPLRADAWLAEVERHVRQRAYVALARVHARAAATAAGAAAVEAEARRALEQLGLAYLHGLRDAALLARDADLAVLADRSGFRELLDRLAAGE
jgi:tetratricopeptide (TPR) repeat protein